MCGFSKLIKNARSVITEPARFFSRIRGEKTGETISYLLALNLFFAAMNSIVKGNMGLATLLGLVVLYIAGIAGYFVSAAVIHLFAKFLGGKKHYADTLKAVVYGNTPHFLFGWLPAIGFLASFWGLYLEIIGLSKLQHMTIWRAAGAVFGIVVVIAALALLAGGLAAVWMATLAGSMMRG